MADYCMVCGTPSPCADHKIIVEPKTWPIKRPHSDSADMRAHQMALYVAGASAQPGSPNFEGGAAYEDYQVHSAPWTARANSLEARALELRNLAQLTADYLPADWDKFERVALQILRHTWETGRQSEYDYTRAPENQPENLR